MRVLYFLPFFLLLSVHAAQLKVVAESFEGNEKSGVTVFRGNVQITKDSDELNASVVTIHTNGKRQPTKYVAEGKVTFFIKTENNALYRGRAEKAVFIPAKKEYRFFTNVHIEQIGQKKEINGEEVVVSTIEGKAHAKGGDTKPVIMTFEIEEEDKK